MGHRAFREIVVFAAAAAAAFAGQNTSLHPIDKPGAKIEYMYKAHLTDPEKKAIVELVFQKSGPSDCVFPGRTEQQEIDFIRVAQVQLGQHDTDLLVQASDRCNCGGTGNCGFWVLHQKQDGFEILLDTYLVQQFSFEPTRSHGYRDLLTASHGSALLQGLVLYQFDGKQYRARQCATAEYHPTGKEKNGYEILGGKPTITPEPCAEK